MKRLLFALLALVLAAVAALAGDTIGGGDGGAINLPGGRNGSGMQSNGGGSQSNGGATSEWIVGAKTHLRLRPHQDMSGAVAVLRSLDLPFTLTLVPVDGVITVTLEAMRTLQAAQETGFVLDLVTIDGRFLRVTVQFLGADELRVTAD